MKLFMQPVKSLKAAPRLFLCALAIGGAFCLSLTPLHAANGTWNVNGSGIWNNAINWTPSGTVPGGAGSVVGLNNNISLSSTVTIDGSIASQTVGTLSIGDAVGTSTYVLRGTNSATLTFDNGTNAARLNFQGGGSTISLPVLLNSSLDIAGSGAANLTMSGSISSATAGLKTITNIGVGTGAISLAGTIANGSAGSIRLHQNSSSVGINISAASTNSFSGGVLISSGTLAVTTNGGGSGVTQLGSGTVTLDGGALRLYHFSSLNLGNATEVLSDSSIVFGEQNGGSPVNHTLGTLTIGASTLSLVNRSLADTTGDDSLTFGAITLTGNSIFSVQKGTAAILSPRVNLGALNGAYNLTKTGDGILNLTAAAGSYTGTTAVNGGTLIVGNNTALGSEAATVSGTAASVLRINAGVTVANAVRFSSTNAGSSVQRLLTGSGASYNVGTTGGLRSDFADGVDTFASIRNGVSSGTTTLTMSFSTDAVATNESYRVSDVFSIAASQTNTYVMQLSTGLVETDDIYLGWLDGDEWVVATLGNAGSGALAAEYNVTWDSFLASQGGVFNAATMLGAYGFDATTGTTWAVLNHTGDMAVLSTVPEPSTYMLFGAAMGVMLLRWRFRWRFRKR